MSRSTYEQSILVVDDIPDNIEVLRGILKPNYTVMAAINGEKALEIARSDNRPDMILLDVMMPGMDGYDVCRKLKEDPKTAGIPVIFITAKDEIENEELGFDLGAVDYITKPIRPRIVLSRVKTHIALYDQNRTLEYKVRERTALLNQTRLQIIQRLGRAAEYKDNETGMHIMRMSNYSRLLAQAAGMDDTWVELLYNAAPMHDIGKIGIPDSILLKPGKLDAQEWETMKTHCDIGARIIGRHSDSDLLRLARSVALTHHEKWNGSGYPHGLAGENIPLVGRIVAIADVFDALTSIRPYKDAWPVDKAVEWMKSESGQHFDPDLVEKFFALLPEVQIIMSQYAD
ncbi:MAG: two-component system response regulator [Candidatus Sedimenticola sp. 20ELBAFRAG]